MLKPRTLYYKFEYRLDPIDIVGSVLNFISTKSSSADKVSDFIKSGYIDLFKDDFVNDSKKDNISSLVTHLTTILTGKLLKLVANSDKDIVFVNTNDNYLITLTGKVTSNISFIEICKILAEYINFDFEVFTSLLSKLHTTPVFIKLFSTFNKEEVKNVVYNVGDIILDGFTQEPVDEESRLLNKVTLKSSLNIDVRECSISEVYDDKGIIGLIIDDYFLPLTDKIFTISNHLLNFTKLYLSSSFSNKKPDSEFKDEFEEFLNDSKDENFLELLSKLTNNLYLTFDILADHSEYERYFNELYLVKGLKNLEKFHYFVNSDKTDRENVSEKKILLGIYTDSKIESEYNLLHWLTLDIASNNYKDYAGNAFPLRTKLDKVWALNQECSYYFISSFFEDYFEKILKEIDIQFLRNITFNYSEENTGREIDFMLYLKDKIVMVECKTRLDKNNIEDTIQKTEKLYSEIPNEIDKSHIEFLMVSLFYNENIRDHFSPFINESTGAKTVDFHFRLPCGKEMRCISSREPNKLRQKISDL